MAFIPKVSSSRWRLPRRYKVQSIIGSGAYGSVSEVYDQEAHRLVAVKRQKQIFRDEVISKRILREIAILRKLRHGNVVRVYDVLGPTDANTFDELYYVMEICDSDLKQLLRTDVTLEPLAINTLLYNLLVGLKYLHSAGICHRDLKPANCLVNQDCSLKICDFGLACTFTAEQSHLQTLENTPQAMESVAKPVVPSTTVAWRTLTGHVVTRWYRAPELILLQTNYNEAIDVWSAGCIYAELLQMVKDGVDVGQRSPLFPGSSCYPLSPCEGRKRDYTYHTRGEFEQLNKIFNVLGSPSEEEIGQLESESSKRYAQLFDKRGGVGLQNMFDYAPDESVDMLQRMLQFNPRARITVNQALDHILFAQQIRRPADEIEALEKVVLAFESEAVLDVATLRHYFAEEMRAFHVTAGNMDPKCLPRPVTAVDEVKDTRNYVFQQTSLSKQNEITEASVGINDSVDIQGSPYCSRGDGRKICSTWNAHRVVRNGAECERWYDGILLARSRIV